MAGALAEGAPAGVGVELRGEAAGALADAGAAAERVAAQLLAAGAQGEVDRWVVEWLADHAAALAHRAPQGAADLLAGAGAGVSAGGGGAGAASRAARGGVVLAGGGV